MRDLIGNRIKALREARGWSQDDVARMLGFKDRQTVSAIETGVRRVTAQELLLATEQLGAPLEYFTDPFRLEGEARFSWRQSGVPSERLEEYESAASRWIAAYRTLAGKVGRETRLLRPSLGLTRRSSYEEAIEAGERFSAELDLGDVPAERLVEAMEEKLGILVLMVDAEQGISGAACRLPELDAVLIARGEVEGRRNYDLAHELFHVLTWEAMPPKHVEEAKETGGSRVEQLANNFAAALLMPADVTQQARRWGQLDSDTLVNSLNSVASDLKVTSSALRWRLVNLGELPAARARAIPESSLRNNGGLEVGSQPPLFSKPFAEVLHMALQQGHVSARRAASLVDSHVGELPAILAAHDVEYKVEL
ncbi:helix-turn-helix domain-containing protein [Candidatus Foliamicus sp.]